VSPFQINLTWSDTSTNEAGFMVERSLDGTNFTQIAQLLPNTTTYRNNGAWPGTTYYYRVRAYNAGGDSVYSNVGGTVTPTLCPNALVAWGDNSYGETTVPPGLTNVVAIAAGSGGDVLALRSDGTVIGWGYNWYGEATPPAGLSNVVAISASGHSLALKRDGTVVGWGDNDAGEASPPAGLSNVVAVAAGGLHSMALKSDGTAVCWGYNYCGQATPPAGLQGVVAIAAGANSSLALKSDGTVVEWGLNCGDSAPPSGLSGVVAISMFSDNALALLGNGTVVGWGDNTYGENNPPSGLSGVAAIAAAGFYNLALKSDGTVVGWGDNLFNEATPPAGLQGVTAIDGAAVFSLALTCAPNGPSNLTATPTAPDQISLSWVNTAATQDEVLVEQAVDASGSPSTWWQIATLGGTATNYTSGGLGLNAKFWYRVRAHNSFGDSIYSNETNAPTQPAAPILLTIASVSPSQISLSWVNLANYADGIVVERALDSGGVPGVWSQVATIGSDSTSYVDNAVALNTTYWYRLQAYNANGYSPCSDPVNATTVPFAPSSLTATTVSTNQVNLAWTNNGPADGVAIQRAPDSNGSPGTWVQITTVSSSTTNYSDVGLASNATYWYRVQAFTARAVSAFSNTASAAVPSVAAPSGLMAIGVSVGVINLTWTNNSTTELGFLIERAPDNGGVPGAWAQIASVGALANSYSDTGLQPLTLYWYRVRAYDNTGDSIYSNVVGAFPPAPCPRYVAGWGNNDDGQTTTPTGLASVIAIAANSAQSLALSRDGTVVGWGDNDWGQSTPPAGLTGVVAIANGDGFSLALKSDGTVIGWGNDMWGVTPPAGTTGVVAIAAGGNESLALKNNGVLVVWGDTLGVTSLTGVVAMAAGLYHSLAVTTNGIVIGWGDNSAGQATSPPGLTGVVAVAVGDYHSLALKCDGTVVGWGDNSFGESAPPAGLGGVVAIAAGGYHSLALKSNGVVVAWGDNSYGASEPPEGLTNVIAIAAGWSFGLALSLPCPLGSPSSLAAGAHSSSQIGLSWLNNSPGATGFAIERAPDNGGVPGTFAQIATVSSNVTTYSDIGLLPNTTYWYRVRAFSGTTYSDYSNQASAMTLPLAPLAPTNLTAAPLSGSQVSVTWTDAANDETGFAIERAPDGGGTPGAFAQIATVGSNVMTYVSGGLTTNTTYWYRVRASNVGGYSPFSNVTNATTFASSFDSWINSGSWKWEDGCGVVCPWSLGVPPNVYLSGVLITNDGSKVVTIDATTVSNAPSTMTISNLTVSAPAGATNTLLVSTAGTNTPLHVLQAIGIGSGGVLDLENSALQMDAANTKSGFTVDGAFSCQNGSRAGFGTRSAEVPPFVVGNVATGLMVVSAGTVTAGGGTIGYSAGSQGTLVISNGATVRVSSLTIGQLAGATGSVWITGGELTTTNGGQPNWLTVGPAGTGQMTISNGTVLSGRVSIGGGATVTIAGGKLVASSILNIGSTSAGGSVWVTGGQLVATNVNVLIGTSGPGQLTITAGSAQMSSATVANNTGGPASLTVTGGTASVLSSLVIGNCSGTTSGQVVVAGTGSLFVTNASHTAILNVSRGTLVVGPGGLLQVDTLIMTNTCGQIVRNGGTIIVSNLVLDPNLSAVGDGILNGWKQQYGLDPLDSNLANKDLDGTGLTVLQDYLAGLDPTNGSSAFRITAIAPVGADMRVWFTSVSGKYYALQRCDFMGGAWTSIVTNIPGNGGIQWTKDVGAAARGTVFYRIVLSQLSSPPPADSDGDGLPDLWTETYFGHPTGQANDLSCATCDADGTGQNNLFKYTAGLDPTNPTSVFVLNIAGGTNQPPQNNLFFTPLALGRAYTPQFSTDLTSGVWLPLTTYTGPLTNGSQITITDTNPIPPQEFYRIGISLP